MPEPQKSKLHLIAANACSYNFDFVSIVNDIAVYFDSATHKIIVIITENYKNGEMPQLNKTEKSKENVLGTLTRTSLIHIVNEIDRIKQLFNKVGKNSISFGKTWQTPDQRLLGIDTILKEVLDLVEKPASKNREPSEHWFKQNDAWHYEDRKFTRILDRKSQGMFMVTGYNHIAGPSIGIERYAVYEDSEMRARFAVEDEIEKLRNVKTTELRKADNEPLTAETVKPHEILKGLRSIDLSKVNNGFLLSFVPDTIRKLMKGWELSGRQTEVAFDIICKNAPKATLDELGIVIAPPKEKDKEKDKEPNKPTVKTSQPETPDQIIMDLCQEITPYISVDAKWFKPFAKDLQDRRSLSVLQREICLLHIVNYWHQLTEESQDKLERLAEIGIRLPVANEFYSTFTEHYIRFLVQVAKYATESGIIFAEKAVDEFIATKGKGDPESAKEKENPYTGESRVTWKDVNKQTIKWEAIVTKVYEKLLKAVNKPPVSGRSLASVAQYIKNPQLFQDFLGIKIGEVDITDKSDVTHKNAELRNAEKTKIADKVTDEITTSYARTYTAEEKEAAHTAMRVLTEMCQDYATVWNNQGFNKAHTRYGHMLAAQPEILDEQMPHVLFMMRFYRKQLPDDLLRIVSIIADKAKKPESTREFAKTIIQNDAARYLECCTIS